MAFQLLTLLKFIDDKKNKLRKLSDYQFFHQVMKILILLLSLLGYIGMLQRQVLGRPYSRVQP